MSELPDDLRALLNLAKDGHDPTDPGAQRRVRHAVAASLLLSSSTAASSSVFPKAAAGNSVSLAEGAKATKAAWMLFGSKVTTLAAGTAAVVGLSLASYHFAARTPEGVPQHAPKAAPLRPVAAASASAMAPEPAAGDAPVLQLEPTVQALSAALDAQGEVDDATTTPPASTKLRRARPNAEDLAAEMALVRAASDALARGDEPGALLALREHARRFAGGSLRVEREGLRAIAECSRASAPSDASAKRFLQVHPHSLMSARVTKACAIE